MINIKENSCDCCESWVTVCPNDCIEVMETSREIDNSTDDNFDKNSK